LGLTVARAPIGRDQPKDKAHHKRSAKQDNKIGCVKGIEKGCRIIESVSGNQQLYAKNQIKPRDNDQDKLPDPPINCHPGLFRIFLIVIFMHNKRILTKICLLSIHG
jgi:hypothetical protein